MPEARSPASITGYMDAVSLPTEILPDIWLGDETDAKTFEGAVVSVHESPLIHVGDHHVPVMMGRRGDPDCPTCREGARLRRHLCSEHFDADSFRASRLMLDAATSIMRHYQAIGVPVLVHCASGIERSPLTMMWFLKRYGYERTLPDALETVRTHRPIVQDRLTWLSPARPRDEAPPATTGA